MPGEAGAAGGGFVDFADAGTGGEGFAEEVGAETGALNQLFGPLAAALVEEQGA
ncbi:MAG: hypothetical protein M5U12_35930 [Verrucomicrobia bacterium]|nr:hypothetical protein [Verrucomicrobiota bacterium]